MTAIRLAARQLAASIAVAQGTVKFYANAVNKGSMGVGIGQYQNLIHNLGQLLHSPLAVLKQQGVCEYP